MVDGNLDTLRQENSITGDNIVSFAVHECNESEDRGSGLMVTALFFSTGVVHPQSNAR